MSAPQGEPSSAAPHCTHWSEGGEWCCGCEQVFPDVLTSMEAPPCLTPEPVETDRSVSPGGAS